MFHSAQRRFLFLQNKGDVTGTILYCIHSLLLDLKGLLLKKATVCYKMDENWMIREENKARVSAEPQRSDPFLHRLLRRVPVEGGNRLGPSSRAAAACAEPTPAPLPEPCPNQRLRLLMPHRPAGVPMAREVAVCSPASVQPWGSSDTHLRC